MSVNCLQTAQSYHRRPQNTLKAIQVLTWLQNLMNTKEKLTKLEVLQRPKRRLPFFGVGRHSSVCKATRYGLDGPGIESRWWRGFPYLSRRALGLTKPPIQCVLGLSLGGKAAGAWSWPPTLLQHGHYRYSRAIPMLPLWAFVACSRVKFTVLTFFSTWRRAVCR
jgi:hypothetical protein